MPSSKRVRYVSGSKSTAAAAINLNIPSYARGTASRASHVDNRSATSSARGGRRGTAARGGRGGTAARGGRGGTTARGGKGSRGETIIGESCFVATQESTAATL